MAPNEPARRGAPHVKVRDLPVRLFHWLPALLVFDDHAIAKPEG